MHDNMVLCDGHHTGAGPGLAIVCRGGLLADQCSPAGFRHRSAALEFRQPSGPGSASQADGSERDRGSIGNLCLLWVPSTTWLLAARFVTGVALAGIYPPALKLMSTWFVRGRGTALGFVIAALTFGSALPHLARFLINRVHWQAVVVAASICTLAGAALMVFFAAEGPFPFSKAVFNPRYLGVVLRNRPLVLANLGYFGHMWELYAMWGWFLAYVSAASPHLGLAGAQEVPHR